jgi:hypothetical protein
MVDSGRDEWFEEGAQVLSLYRVNPFFLQIRKRGGKFLRIFHY